MSKQKGKESKHSKSNLDEDVSELFEKAQKSQALHSDCSKKMQKLIDVDRGQFRAIFSGRVLQILLVPMKQTSSDEIVERLLSFLTLFACESASNGRRAFCDFFVEYLLELTGVQQNSVRVRSCQLIAAILTGLLNGDSEFDFEESFESQILTALAQRLTDKLVSVRLAAIKGMSFFYRDELDNAETVLECFLQLLANDQACEVRKSILHVLRVSSATVPAIIERTRDVDATVRRAALDVLAEKISIRHLSADVALQLLLDCSSDEALVVEGAKLLLRSWYRECDNKTIELMKHFDALHHEAACEKALFFLFSSKVYDTATENIKDENIDEDLTLYWRVYCDYIKQSEPQWQVDELFAELLPQITVLCQLLTSFESNEFMLRQLLKICLYLDYADELGRRNLLAILVARMKQMKPSDVAMTALMLEVLRLVTVENLEEFIAICLEVIYHLVDSDSDPNHWGIVLTITATILESVKKPDENGITDLQGGVILPALEASDEDIKVMAIRCLALYCLLDEVIAKDYFYKFAEIIQDTHSPAPVTLVAITSLFDFILKFGPTALQDKAQISQKDDAVDENPIIEVLLRQMNGVDEEKRTVCVQGFGKLLINDILDSVSILTALIVEFFNPLTARFLKTRGCLVTFFDTFTAGSMSHVALLDKALLRALHALLAAEEKSFLGKIKLREVMVFFFERKQFAEHPERQLQWAKELLQLVAHNPLGRAGRELPAIVVSFGVFAALKGPLPTDDEKAKTLLQLIKALRSLLVAKCVPYVTDKASLANLKKLQEKLDSLDDSPLDIDSTPAKSKRRRGENDKQPSSAVKSHQKKDDAMAVDPSALNLANVILPPLGLQSALDTVLEQRRQEISEMDKFQLTTQVVGANGLKQKTPQSSIQKERKLVTAFNEDMLQLLGSLESKISNDGSETKSEVFSIFETLKNKYLKMNEVVDVALAKKEAITPRSRHSASRTAGTAHQQKQSHQHKPIDFDADPALDFATIGVGDNGAIAFGDWDFADIGQKKKSTDDSKSSKNEKRSEERRKSEDRKSRESKAKTESSSSNNNNATKKDEKKKSANDGEFKKPNAKVNFLDLPLDSQTPFHQPDQSNNNSSSSTSSETPSSSSKHRRKSEERGRASSASTKSKGNEGEFAITKTPSKLPVTPAKRVSYSRADMAEDNLYARREREKAAQKKVDQAQKLEEIERKRTEKEMREADRERKECEREEREAARKRLAEEKKSLEKETKRAAKEAKKHARELLKSNNDKKESDDGDRASHDDEESDSHAPAVKKTSKKKKRSGEMTHEDQPEASNKKRKLSATAIDSSEMSSKNDKSASKKKESKSGRDVAIVRSGKKNQSALFGSNSSRSGSETDLRAGLKEKGGKKKEKSGVVAIPPESEGNELEGSEEEEGMEVEEQKNNGDASDDEIEVSVASSKRKGKKDSVEEKNSKRTEKKSSKEKGRSSKSSGDSTEKGKSKEKSPHSPKKKKNKRESEKDVTIVRSGKKNKSVLFTGTASGSEKRKKSISEAEANENSSEEMQTEEVTTATKKKKKKKEDSGESRVRSDDSSSEELLSVRTIGDESEEGGEQEEEQQSSVSEEEMEVIGAEEETQSRRTPKTTRLNAKSQDTPSKRAASTQSHLMSNPSPLPKTRGQLSQMQSQVQVVEFVQSQKNPSQKVKSQKKEENKTASKYVVAFTGFAPDTPHDFAMRDALSRVVEKLNGTVVHGDTFDASITHIVTPPKCRTMKTLIASLARRWVVSPDWLQTSQREGFFVKERGYGIRQKTNVFNDKSVFISSDFASSNANYNFENFKTLIETLGKGRITNSAFGADIILVPTLLQHNYHTSGAQCMTWKEFFNLIQPI